MKTIEISYTREVTFKKQVKVTDALAERLLELNGEDLIQGNGSWGGEEEPEEYDEDTTYSINEVSTDGFTALAEDLTDIDDVYDMLNEIENVEVREVKA